MYLFSSPQSYIDTLVSLFPSPSYMYSITVPPSPQASTLTVIDPLATLSAVSVEQPDSSHDGGEFLQLNLLLPLVQSQETSQLHLREHTLQGSCTGINDVTMCVSV